MITDLGPDILECEVKWALESITTNKASGGDGIPVAKATSGTASEESAGHTWKAESPLLPPVQSNLGHTKSCPGKPTALRLSQFLLSELYQKLELGFQF